MRKVAFCFAMALVVISRDDCLQAQTKWRSKYTAVNNNQISAEITLSQNGSSGTYKSYDNNGNYVGNGTLSNVKFYSENGKSGIKGDWSWAQGGSGRFEWKLSNGGKQFDGLWWSTGGGGGGNGPAKPWTGSFSDGTGAVGENGPVISK